MATENKLEQTKGQFRMVGIIKGISNEKAYHSGTSEKNGKEWRNVRFGVQTSPTNVNYVELMGMERDQVYAYNSTKKKGDKFPWAKRNNLPQGYAVLAASLGLEKDDKGKTVRHSMSEYDAVELIYNNLNDGDHVYVNGEIHFDKYVNNDGEEKEMKHYTIKSIGFANKVDFEAEDFKEVSDFEQEIVVNGLDTDNDAGKTFISAYVLEYGKEHPTVHTGSFVIDHKTSKPEFVKNMAKKLKFGDFIKIHGKIVNAVELVEVEDVTDDWGGESSTFNKAVKNTIQELRVLGVDPNSFVQKKYTESQLVSATQANDAFGGGNDNPFGKNKDKGHKPTTNEVDDDDDVPFDLN